MLGGFFIDRQFVDGVTAKITVTFVGETKKIGRCHVATPFFYSIVALFNASLSSFDNSITLSRSSPAALVNLSPYS